MTPTLVQSATYSTLVTCATIEPSPASGRYTYRKASAVPHTSAPAPLAVNVASVPLALPAAPTDPTSVVDQPSRSGWAVAAAEGVRRTRHRTAVTQYRTRNL